MTLVPLRFSGALTLVRISAMERRPMTSAVPERMAYVRPFFLALLLTTPPPAPSRLFSPKRLYPMCSSAMANGTTPLHTYSL